MLLATLFSAAMAIEPVGAEAPQTELEAVLQETADVANWEGCEAFELPAPDRASQTLIQCEEANLIRVATGPTGLSQEELLDDIIQLGGLPGTPVETTVSWTDAESPAVVFLKGRKAYGVATVSISGPMNQAGICFGPKASKKRQAWCERALTDALAPPLPMAEERFIELQLTKSSDQGAEPGAGELPFEVDQEGIYSRAEIDEAVQAVLPGVRACEAPDGEVGEISFTVDAASGSVSDVALQAADSSWQDCARSALTELSLPPRDGGSVTISYPWR